MKESFSAYPRDMATSFLYLKPYVFSHYKVDQKDDGNK